MKKAKYKWFVEIADNNNPFVYFYYNPKTTLFAIRIWKLIIRHGLDLYKNGNMKY